MLYAGLDLSRKRLDFHLLDADGATVEGGAAPPDADVKGANIRVASLGAVTGRIGGMASSFLYLALRALLGALVRSGRGLHVKPVELLVLRHGLELLGPQVARPKLST